MKNKINILLLTICCGLNLTAQNVDYPTLKPQSPTIKGFAPKGWEVGSEAEGDLNKDGLKDAVFLVTKTEGVQAELDDEYMMHPSILCAAFWDDKLKVYTLKVQANKFIENAYTSTQDEPFDGISIERGAFHVNFRFWASAGTWFAGNAKYIFRWQNNQFELIGEGYTSFHRGTGEGSTGSINYSTRKSYSAGYSISSDVDKDPKWTTFKINKLFVLGKNTTRDDFSLPSTKEN